MISSPLYDTARKLPEIMHAKYFQVSHRWYGEIQSHDFSSLDPNPETSNFTQLVWHDSREIGVGKAVGRDGFSVVVAHYSPPGNKDGRVKENVGKLSCPG